MTYTSLLDWPDLVSGLFLPASSHRAESPQGLDKQSGG